MQAATTLTSHNRLFLAILAGMSIGTLGGLIGLGGAEFRLPLLIGLFGFVALQAVILNKTMSLVVVVSALFFRARAVPMDQVVEHAAVVLNLLAGSLLGAWWGADWAIQIGQQRLYKVIAGLLVGIAAVLLLQHLMATSHQPLLHGWTQVLAGVAAGLVIGVAASLLGVAGGELLIPTLILLYGVEVKLAGSLSLVVSLPTMIVGLVRYSRDGSFSVLKGNRSFVVAMAAGSLAGALLGGLLLGAVPGVVLLPTLALILLVSAWKVWRHR